MMFPAVAQISADGFPVRVVCRVLKVSPSSFYDWRSRPPCARDVEDAYLTELIRDVHTRSRQTYGAPRVHAELRLGLGLAIGRKRVERLMRCGGIQGIHRRRWRRGRSSSAVFDDHVQRRFHADAPDRLWFTDITQHRTGEGWVYCAVVLDVFSRRVVGWSIADHLRTELVADALDMARLQRRPQPQQTILHSDRGTQYTSWLFGKRMRDAGLMGSMGAVGSAYDNAAMESFFGSMQIELLDRRTWPTRAGLAVAIFEWIEGFYNPVRRHTSIDGLSPAEFEHLHNHAATAA